MAEEEFGVSVAGPIMLPCDSRFMEYAMSMNQRHAAYELQKALIMSLDTCCYSALSNDLEEQNNQQMLICSF